MQFPGWIQCTRFDRYSARLPLALQLLDVVGADLAAAETPRGWFPQSVGISSPAALTSNLCDAVSKRKHFGQKADTSAEIDPGS